MALKMKRHNVLWMLVILMIVVYSVFFSSSSKHTKLGGVANPITQDDVALNGKNLVHKGKENLDQIKSDIKGNLFDLDDSLIAFMPKMTNETLKAELGNAAWKLFHTILARYPEEPSSDEQSHLTNYILYFAKVYPCGDCARHFQKLLQKFPPQLSSRQTAAVWGCHIHNKVNERLNKPIYDCNHIIEDYDCGCGEDEQEQDMTLNGKSKAELNEHLLNIELDSKEDRQLGG